MKLQKMLIASLLVFAATAFSVHAASEESPEAQFKLLYGDRHEEVTKTPDNADNIKLAKEITEILGYDDIKNDLKLYLVDKILELAPASDQRSGDILETTTEWMLDQDKPTQARALATQAEMIKAQVIKTPRAQRGDLYIAHYNKLIEAAQAYKAAMDLDKAFDLYREANTASRYAPREMRGLARDGFKEITKLRSQLKKLEGLKEDFLEAPTETLAKEIATIYLTDFGNANEAKPFASASADAGLLAIAKITGLVVEDVSPDDALAAGEAYGKLSESAAGAAKANVLAPAIAYLNLFLETSEGKGIQQIKAKVKRDNYMKELEKLGGAAGELATRAVDVTKFLVENWEDYSKKYMTHKDSRHWKSTGKSFDIDWGNRDGGWGPQLHFPIKASGGYELEMSIIPGKNGFVLMLPVGDKRVAVMYDSRGINTPGGELTQKKNAVKKLININAPMPKPGTPQVIKIAIKTKKNLASIQFEVDKVKLYTWEGDLKILSGAYMKFGAVSQFGVAPKRGTNLLSIKEVKVTGSVKINPPVLEGGD